MVIRILRADCDDEGSLGVLAVERFCCYTLELPWRNNLEGISCIPDGKYTAHVDNSIKIAGESVIRLEDVPNRSGILIHVGNWAGDVNFNYRSDVKGCILVGLGRLDLGDIRQKQITDSKDAMRELLSIVGNSPIIVDIDWA